MIELHHDQPILSFLTMEENLDFFSTLLSKIIVIVLFLYPTLETASTLEVIFLRIELHQDHVYDQLLHLENLLKQYN